MVGISIPGENSSSRNVIHERILPLADNYSRMFCNRFGMKLALGAVLLMIFVISITTVTKGNTGPWELLDQGPLANRGPSLDQAFLFDRAKKLKTQGKNSRIRQFLV